MSGLSPSTTATEAEPPKKRAPFQFGIIHMLGAMSVLAVLLSLGHYIGVSGIAFLGIIAMWGIGGALWIRAKRFGLFGFLACVAIVGVLIAMLFPAIQSPRDGGPRSHCANNLKQIALALLNYETQYGCFPPAYVADKNGRPMQSWRVLILPFLERDDLYRRYRFDEPWDGPNNSKVAPEGLPVFRCPSDKSGSPSDTNYLVVVGPETAWPGERCVRLTDIADGPAATILVVEVRQSGVRWSEPRDLHVLQMTPTINPKAGQGISSNHPDVANVALADGRVWFFSETLHSPASLRALLTIRGGEAIDANGELR